MIALWPVLSIAAAVVAFVGSLLALFGPHHVYAELTVVFVPQAIAQDIANIVIAAPILAVSAALALRGSLRARLIWLGATAFTVYNYVIYTFSIPFGPLFPLWVTVLGLSVFALIGGLVSIDAARAKPRFTSRLAVTVAAWVLLIVAGMFALLWLSEDVPSLLAGTGQQSAADMNLPTNPVHILDYAFFLPAAIATGILLLRSRAIAYVATPALLAFMILTCIPIMITPAAQASLGLASGSAVLVPVGIIALVLTAALTWLLITVSPPSPRRALL